MNVIHFGLDPQEAINVPHYQNRNSYTQLETPIPGVTLDYDAEGLVRQLRDDYEYSDVRVGIMTSGLSSIQVEEFKYAKPGKRHGKGHKHKMTLLVGGADQRRDGTVGGR